MEELIERKSWRGNANSAGASPYGRAGQNIKNRGHDVALFLSTYTNKVDKKGRVSVPQAFRSSVQKSAFGGVAIYRNRNPHCLEGTSHEFIAQLTKSIYSEHGSFNPALLSVATTILAGLKELQFDPGGRILLPEEFRSYANIEDYATFVGLGPKFLIMNPETYDAFQGQQWEKAEQDLLSIPPLDIGGGS